MLAVRHLLVFAALSGVAWSASTAMAQGAAPASNVRGAADDESVYVVQERASSKRGHFEITPMFTVAVDPKFVGHVGGGISLAYHIHENLAVEMVHAVQHAFYTDMVHHLWRYEDLVPEDVDLKQIVYFSALSLQFSALYGKLDFYGWLVDYDVFISGGLGYALMRRPCPADPWLQNCGARDIARIHTGNRGRTLDTHKLTGNLGLGFRMFFHDLIGLRLELRDIVFADRSIETLQAGVIGQTTTDIRNTLMLFVGASLML